jgi:hypothetical protein
VIGGRVLDTSALLRFASNTSIYMQSAVWVALEEGLVLSVPATALTEAWARSHSGDHDVLDVLLGLPITVVDPLDADEARRTGRLLAASSEQVGEDAAADVRTGHVVHTARRRGWPVLTAVPESLRRLDPELEVDELP